MNGAVLIDKKEGLTSFDVVRSLRRIFHEKKAGHNGTLDPMATGLLEVFLGRATKAIPLLSEHDKVYEGELLLGISTDTEDRTGEIISDRSDRVEGLSEEEILRAFEEVGKRTSQIPPMFSARHKDGQRLYELARKGMVIPRDPAEIHVYSLDVTSVSLPHVRFRAHVSKGTYIRSLCRDIGEFLGTGGCMSMLRRVKIGGADISDSHTLEELEELSGAGRLGEVLLPVDSFFSEKKGFADKNAERYIVNGNPVYISEVHDEVGGEIPDERIRLYLSDGRFAGIYQRERDSDIYRPVRLFLET